MLLIKAGHLVDGTGGPASRNVAVAVEEGRITSIVPLATVAEAEREVVDLGEATLLPGFIDTHAHLMFEPLAEHTSVIDTLARDSEEIGLLRAARHAQLALSAGVTTIRDCGGRGLTTLALRDAVASGLVVGPRILAAGPAITTTRGHLWYLGMEADSGDEVLKAGRRLVKAGADFIKICVTGGNMTAGSNSYLPQYSVDVLRALVEDAHRLGVKVVGHVHGTPGIRAAVAAGIDDVEHCTWVGEDGGTDYDRDVAQEMMEKGIHVGLTFTGVQRMLLPSADTPEVEQGRQLERLQENVAVFRTLLADGVSAVVSSDAGVRNTRFEDFAQSLEVMAKGCGATPVQAIAAATRLAAESLGLAREIGTLEVGKVADMVAVDGDPLRDLRALRHVRAVIRGGRVVFWNGRLALSR